MSNHANPIAQLIHSTVRIVCVDANGQQSSGTGYIYMFCEREGNAVPCVVTNKHVIEGAQRGVFNLTLRKSDGSPDLGRHEEISVEGLESFCLKHPDQSVDLAALPIGAILNAATKSGKDYYYIPIGKQLIPPKDMLNSLSPWKRL